MGIAQQLVFSQSGILAASRLPGGWTQGQATNRPIRDQPGEEPESDTDGQQSEDPHDGRSFALPLGQRRKRFPVECLDAVAIAQIIQSLDQSVPLPAYTSDRLELQQRCCAAAHVRNDRTHPSPVRTGKDSQGDQEHGHKHGSLIREPRSDQGNQPTVKQRKSDKADSKMGHRNGDRSNTSGPAGVRPRQVEGNRSGKKAEQGRQGAHHGLDQPLQDSQCPRQQPGRLFQEPTVNAGSFSQPVIAPQGSLDVGDLPRCFLLEVIHRSRNVLL